MRIRSVLAAALGGGVLVLAIPAAASAATGEFSYRFHDDGMEQVNTLVDPPSRHCITLPEVAGPDSRPADSPRNRTDSTATVFTGPDCTGDYFSLRPFTGYGSDRLKVRSVVFS